MSFYFSPGPDSNVIRDDRDNFVSLSDAQLATLVGQAASYADHSITTAADLLALAPETRLYSPRTHHVWWRSDRRHFAVEGSGGAYTRATDALLVEGPLTVIYAPSLATV